MKLLANFLDIVCSLNEIFWLYQWTNLLLEKKDFAVEKGKKYLEVALYLTYVAVVFCFNRIVLTSPYTMLVVVTINFLAVLYFWKSNIVQVFAVVGGYFFALFLIGNVEILLTGIVGGDELIQATTAEQGGIRVIYLLLCGGVLFSINRCLTTYIKKKTIREQSMRYIAFVSIVGIIGCVFLANFMLSSFGIHISVVWYVFAGVLSIASCIFYLAIKRREERLQMQFLEAQNEMLERNYTQVNEFYTANAKLYHDMNHHFDAVYHMLQEGNEEQAKDYIASLRSRDNYSKIETRSGINVIDAILYETGIKAKQKGVGFKIDIPLLPCDLGIENKDMCSLFANLLDNALEAASKEVNLEVKKVHQTLLIKVKNDYSVAPIRQEGRFVTRKSEKSLHGWGTRIVEQIARKYEGNIEYEATNDTFVVYVMLNEKLISE